MLRAVYTYLERGEYLVIFFMRDIKEYFILLEGCKSNPSSLVIFSDMY